MNYAIIAAGEGSRLAREGVMLPKPLVSLNGTPMIERLLRIMASCRAESISVIVNEQMTRVREFLERIELPVTFNLVVKTTPGSMHSFREVTNAIPGTGKFIATTVDTIFREDEFRAYVEAFEADNNADGLMAVTSFIDDEKPLYIDVDPTTMRITDFRDEPFPGVRFISGGIYGLTAPALTVLDQCMAKGICRMRNYQRELISSGLNLRAYPFEKIVDVDHAADIPTAEQFIAGS